MRTSPSVDQWCRMNRLCEFHVMLTTEQVVRARTIALDHFHLDCSRCAAHFAVRHSTSRAPETLPATIVLENGRRIPVQVPLGRTVNNTSLYRHAICPFRRNSSSLSKNWSGVKTDRSVALSLILTRG